MPAKKQWIKLKCLECCNEFEVEPYRQHRAKFCGWKCKQSSGARNASISRRGTGKMYVKVGGRHEHRIVAEQMLGRPLLPGEIVHHRNRDKKDNRPENLEVMWQSEHARHHHPHMLEARKEKAGY